MLVALGLLIAGWLWVDLVPEGVVLMATLAGLLLMLAAGLGGDEGEDEVAKLRRDAAGL